MKEKITINQLIKRHQQLQDGIEGSKRLILYWARKGDYKKAAIASEELAKFESDVNLFLQQIIEVPHVPLNGYEDEE